MVPESTLKELETASIAAHHCLMRLLVVKTKIEDQPRDSVPALFAEAIKEPAWEFLESWRALYAALSPHVERDFIAVCKEPVEIGEAVIAESALSATVWVSHLAIIHLSMVLMPTGYWPSSADPKTDCFLLDLRSDTPVDASESAVRALRTVFNQLSIRELRKCIVLVTRECVAACSQLPTAANVENVESLEQCKPSERQAYYSYKLAEARAERRLEDREAYDLLDELLADEDSIEQFTGELTDYKLPSFGTWSRQLRTARRATNERKYTPRTHK
jgi:hypothetical protein